MARLFLLFAAVLQAAGSTPAPEPAVEVASGIHLIRGAVVEDRGPDGNTLLLDAPDGLVVVDTGRHTYHSDAILAFAKARQRPIVAIVNTHWHLDHSSGNRRLKAAYPKAQVYTTRAIDGALAPGGFLTRNLEQARARLGAADVNAVQKEETQIFLETMALRDSLRPDVPVARTGPLQLGGLPLDAHVTDGAVSAADLWLFEPKTKVAILGDLVTMPVPYFETACPDHWRSAMDDVWATPFTTAVPGHGRPMTREQFDTYRQAFSRFVSCVRTETSAPAACAAGWSDAITPLVGGGDDRRKAIAGGAEYYVGYLRKGGGKAPDCTAH